MKRIQKFQQNRQDKVIGLKQKEAIKGGMREFLRMGTGNPVNHARYALACQCARSIMLVRINHAYYFCIDW